MKDYSIDLRERMLKNVDTRMTTHLIALKYDGSESWVRRLKQRRREYGEVSPRQPASQGKSQVSSQQR